MCTVFAESEVISLLAAGRDRASIALGLHGSIADRVYPLAARFDVNGEVVMAGGVALNPCLVDLLSQRLGRPWSSPSILRSSRLSAPPWPHPVVFRYNMRRNGYARDGSRG